MTNLQKKQFMLFDLLGKNADLRGLIETQKSIFCVCDTCEEYESFVSSKNVRDWLMVHENHETWLWFRNTTSQEVSTPLDNGPETTDKDRILEKIRKLYLLSLSENNPFNEEAKSAAQKAKDLLVKYNISVEEAGIFFGL